MKIVCEFPKWDVRYEGGGYNSSYRNNFRQNQGYQGNSGYNRCCLFLSSPLGSRIEKPFF